MENALKCVQTSLVLVQGILMNVDVKCRWWVRFFKTFSKNFEIQIFIALFCLSNNSHRIEVNMNWNAETILFSVLGAFSILRYADVDCRRHIQNVQPFLKKKKMKFQIFIALYLNSVCEKCIEMSTNKPSIESVVLEIVLWIFRKNHWLNWTTLASSLDCFSKKLRFLYH